MHTKGMMNAGSAVAQKRPVGNLSRRCSTLMASCTAQKLPSMIPQIGSVMKKVNLGKKSDRAASLVTNVAKPSVDAVVSAASSSDDGAVSVE